MLASLFEQFDKSFWVYMLLTVTLGGAAARVTGSAIATTWRSPWQILGAIFLLACAVRFFHYALFAEPLLSLRLFLLDYGVLLLFAASGYQLTRARQMIEQYPWAYEPAGLLSWRRKGS
jgi:Domain of unknown function (DUF6867)